MNFTASKTSTLIWAIAASLFVVLALGAGYRVFFSHHQPSAREQACQRIKEAKAQTTSSHELTLDEAICSGVSQ